MPYGTPVTGAGGEYTVSLSSVNINQAANIELTMTSSDAGAWTQAGLDALFQELVDLFDGASFVSINSAYRFQGTNTTVTPTP